MFDDKLKNEKSKNEPRPWWVWGMMMLAAFGVCIAIGQALDIVPDRRDFEATQTIRNLITELRAVSTPRPTPTLRFQLPDITLPDTKTKRSSIWGEIVEPVVSNFLSKSKQQ